MFPISFGGRFMGHRIDTHYFARYFIPVFSIANSRYVRTKSSEHAPHESRFVVCILARRATAQYSASKGPLLPHPLFPLP